jgi:hypothetical protein
MVRASDFPVAHTVLLDEQRVHLVHEAYGITAPDTLCGLPVGKAQLDPEAAKRLALCLVCFARDLERAPGRALRR